MNPDDYKGWSLNEQVCPCDIHLLEWLTEKPDDTRVFHMGSGLHHMVGKRHSGHVTAITYSEEEREAYCALAKHDPYLAERYHLRHGDIYQIELGQLQFFDVISLPHLGEFYPLGDHRSGLESALLSKLSAHLNPGGNIVFYNGSFAMTWDWVKQEVKNWAQKDGFYCSEGYKSLSFYSRI